MGKEIPPFSFSAGERKIMAHFVVNPYFAHFAFFAANTPSQCRRKKSKIGGWPFSGISRK